MYTKIRLEQVRGCTFSSVGAVLGGALVSSAPTKQAMHQPNNNGFLLLGRFNNGFIGLNGFLLLGRFNSGLNGLNGFLLLGRFNSGLNGWLRTQIRLIRC